MNVLIFGGSITWGAADPELGGWATHLRNYLEAKKFASDIFKRDIFSAKIKT
jgi:lysophospholipase L1-like esterase